MEDNKNTGKAPIDITEIVKKLWQHRRTYYYVLPATLIITYLFVLCIPRYYKCTVSLAPESSGISTSGSLSSLASSFGIGGALGKMNSQDAIYAEIYPQVLGSYDFLAGLMGVEVVTQKGDIKSNYYTYLRDHQRFAWWDIVKDYVKELFKKSTPDKTTGKETFSVFKLTKTQTEVFNGAKGKIKCTYDKKTDVVSITVQDQDPLVSATIADATCKKLQEFIINYRTNKARIDYDYYSMLCDKSKEEYDNARRVYAAYSDAHQNAVLVSYTAKAEELENEMQLRHNLYTTMNTQKQAAAAKLQEATPAFTLIQSASVPIKPAGPKRMLISIAMMILAFFVLSGRLLLKEEQ